MGERPDRTEIAAAGMYGKNWNSDDPSKRPGEKMKDVWRRYASDALAAIDALPTSEPEGWRDIAATLVRAKCYIISFGPLDDERQRELYLSITKDLDAAIAPLPPPPEGTQS